MPLLKTINFNPTTEILLWKITESLAELSAEVTLNPKNQQRFNGMKSELHQRAFLSVRKLLQLKGYTDFDLEYDQFGKPHLKDGKHISISHSHEYATIIISDEITGIDIELQRDKIIRIAYKQVNLQHGKHRLLDRTNNLLLPVAFDHHHRSRLNQYHKIWQCLAKVPLKNRNKWI